MSQTTWKRTQLRPQTDSAQWRRPIGPSTKKWTSWLQCNESSNTYLSTVSSRNASSRFLLTVSVQINECILCGSSEWFNIFYSTSLHAKTPRTPISFNNTKQFLCIPIKQFLWCWVFKLRAEKGKWEDKNGQDNARAIKEKVRRVDECEKHWREEVEWTKLKCGGKQFCWIHLCSFSALEI